jgi:hypothetical protein
MALSDAAETAARSLEQLAASLAKVGAAADATLADAIKRGQAPELIEALKKALRL